jgi:hypothetical protein
MHFIATVKRSKVKRALIVLEATELARGTGILLFSFPADTTHRLSPLDVSLLKPPSRNSHETCDKWIGPNPGRIVSRSEIGQFLGEEYGRAPSVGIAVSGFARTGI